MALNLGPGERVIFQGHPSWRSILGLYATGIIALAVIVALLILIGGAVGDGIGAGPVVVVLLAGAAAIALVGFVKRVATRYTITNRRLNIRRGIVSRDVQETRIERVQDVSYRQSVWQRVLQVGDVDFDTAAHEDPDSDFVFAGVARPEQVVDQVHRATDPAGAGSRSRAPL